MKKITNNQKIIAVAILVILGFFCFYKWPVVSKRQKEISLVSQVNGISSLKLYKEAVNPPFKFEQYNILFKEYKSFEKLKAGDGLRIQGDATDPVELMCCMQKYSHDFAGHYKLILAPYSNAGYYGNVPFFYLVDAETGVVLAEYAIGEGLGLNNFIFEKDSNLLIIDSTTSAKDGDDTHYYRFLLLKDKDFEFLGTYYKSGDNLIISKNSDMDNELVLKNKKIIIR